MLPNPFVFRFEPKAHQYFLGSTELPGITWVLKDNGLLPEFFANDEALKRGTFVHKCCELLDHNDLNWDSVPDKYMGYVIAWERFRKTTGFVPEINEKSMYHPLLMFAGTPDREGYVLLGERCERWIVEIKTGEPLPATALQTAAHELLISAQPGAIQVPRKRLAVKLNENGSYHLSKPYRDHRDQNMFLTALAMSNWRIQHGYTYTQES